MKVRNGDCVYIDLSMIARLAEADNVLVRFFGKLTYMLEMLNEGWWMQGCFINLRCMTASSGTPVRSHIQVSV